MDREQARAELERLAAGVRQKRDPASRLLERIADQGEADELRAALVELGAEAVTGPGTTAR